MKLSFKSLCNNKEQHAISLWQALLGLGTLLFPLAGWSECPVNGAYTRVYANVPSPISVSPEVSVGQVIGSMTTAFPAGQVGCSISGPGGQVVAKGSGIANGKLYPTSIPGVSYRAKNTQGWNVSGMYNVYWPATGNFSGNFATGNYEGGTITIELVKTGPVPGTATWQPGVLGTIQIVVGGVTFNFLEIYNSNPATIIPTVPSCTITQSAITVNLNDANTSQLTAAGNSSQDKSFNIPLACTAPVNISMGFSGDVANNANAVFSNLSGSANASTVGVQILSGSTPVPTTAGSYLNLGVVNGSTSVPLIARYYALVNNPDAGDVSAIAYATLVYN